MGDGVRTISLLLLILTISSYLLNYQVGASIDSEKNFFEDQSRWNIWSFGDPIIIFGERLTISTNSKYDSSGAIISLKEPQNGDFDAQVGFSGVGWGGNFQSYRGSPCLVAAGLGISTNRLNINIKYMINGLYEGRPAIYIENVTFPEGAGPVILWIDVSNRTSGKLRIFRSGSDVKFQSYEDNKWLTYYILTNVEPLQIELSASTIYTNHTFSTTFSNLKITTGPSSITPVVGDLGPPHIHQFGLFYPGNVSWSSEVKIYATYSDKVDLDPALVKLKIDGQAITSGVSISPFSLWYSTSLLPGSHKIELTVSDMTGNVDSKSQSIMVIPLEFSLLIFAAILVIGFVIFRIRTQPHDRPYQSST